MRRRSELLCCSGLLPSLYVIPQARRNVVVAPRRILSISSLVLAMLLLLLLGVVMPRVDAFVRQPSFVLLDVVDDGSKVCATPTGAPGAGGSLGEPLAAVTLNDDVLRMPVVASAERDLMGLVVRFDVLNDPGHSLVPS